ncbi:hypothetical protein EDB89DRAFT_1979507 [Lactarius sanguifluus]|nr:hypothetical protein EDB89DRAFT_1979507 [Lactarius sanguifluus]
MEENDERKDRDVRAIQWLIHNRTEDDEMESFVMAIPGAFTSKWGVEVWRKVCEIKQCEDTNSRSNDATARPQTDVDLRVSAPPLHHTSSPPQYTFHPRSFLRPLGLILGIPTINGVPRDMTMSRSIPHLPNGNWVPGAPHATRELAINDLCKGVRRLLDTCNNRGLFAKEELWRQRARGCIETVASLVFCADLESELFGDLGRLLGELGKVEKIRELSAAESDGSFVARWTCLSLVVVAQGISNNSMIKWNARLAIEYLSLLRMADDGVPANNDNDEDALKNAQRIDNHFETARQFCVYGLHGAFRPQEVGWSEEQVRDVLARDYEVGISTLERIAPAVVHMKAIDRAISWICHWIHSVNPNLIVHLPGVSFDEFEGTELIQPSQFFNPSVSEGQAFTPQLIFLHQRLRLLCSYAPKLRDIIDGRGSGAYQEILESLRTLRDDPDRRRSIVHQRHLMERQLWRLQDLRDSGGFGFSVELFFLALAQPLSTMSPRRDAHSTLYIGTFRAMTSNWRQYKHCMGTQRVILNLVCDVAIPGRGIFSDSNYPRYFTNELLVLLGNMVEGQSGSHIDDAMKELGAFLHWLKDDPFVAEVMSTISSRSHVSSRE